MKQEKSCHQNQPFKSLNAIRALSSSLPIRLPLAMLMLYSGQPHPLYPTPCLPECGGQKGSLSKWASDFEARLERVLSLQAYAFRHSEAWRCSPPEACQKVLPSIFVRPGRGSVGRIRRSRSHRVTGEHCVHSAANPRDHPRSPYVEMCRSHQTSLQVMHWSCTGVVHAISTGNTIHIIVGTGFKNCSVNLYSCTCDSNPELPVGDIYLRTCI